MTDFGTQIIASDPHLAAATTGAPRGNAPRGRGKRTMRALASKYRTPVAIVVGTSAILFGAHAFSDATYSDYDPNRYGNPAVVTVDPDEYVDVPDGARLDVRNVDQAKCDNLGGRLSGTTCVGVDQ